MGKTATVSHEKRVLSGYSLKGNSYSSVTTELPFEHVYDGDLSIKAKVFAWHKNVKIRQVRFYVDEQQTTTHGPEGLFYTTNLFNSGNKNLGGHFYGQSNYLTAFTRN